MRVLPLAVGASTALLLITMLSTAHAMEEGSGDGSGQLPDKPTGQDLLRLMRMAHAQPGAVDPNKALDLGTLLREAEADEQLCTTTCEYSDDGSCDDGGYGSASSLCKFGTDCDDCGPRPKDRALRCCAGQPVVRECRCAQGNSCVASAWESVRVHWQ